VLVGVEWEGTNKSVGNVKVLDGGVFGSEFSIFNYNVSDNDE
jgi:hypothetical protein